MKKSHKNRDRSRDRGNDRRDRYNDHDDYRRYEKKHRNSNAADNRKVSKKSDVIQVSSEDEDNGVQIVHNKSEDSYSKLEIPEDDSDEEAVIERRRKERQKLLEKLESKKAVKSHFSTFEKISASTEIQDDREDEDDDMNGSGFAGLRAAEPQKPVNQVMIILNLIF